jgi:hypothetical protein
MHIKEHQDTKIITLSKALDSRAKILNIFYFIAYSSIVLFFISLIISAEPDFTSIRVIIGVTALVLFILVYFIAAYRFLNKAFQTETLIIDPNSIRLYKGGFSKKSGIYDISLISNFRHLDKPTLTNHALAGQSFDYLGFQTQQQVINEMHGDNRLAFDYEGKTVAFGENIYSWDFEELAGILNEIAGRDLTIAPEPTPFYIE